MTIIITHNEKSNGLFFFSATCNKKSAFVSITNHGVQVCCQNESHRVFRKAGKRFDTIQEAVDHYRSPEMKAIIRTAEIESARSQN